jgi:lipid-A-disaccharide synthase
MAYRVNPLTHAWLRRIVKVDYAHLLNLILGRGVVPELIQQDCTAEKLAAAIEHLLVDAGAREAQNAGCQEGLRRLGLGTLAPSRRAAETIWAIIADHKRGQQSAA